MGKTDLKRLKKSAHELTLLLTSRDIEKCPGYVCFAYGAYLELLRLGKELDFELSTIVDNSNL